MFKMFRSLLGTPAEPAGQQVAVSRPPSPSQLQLAGTAPVFPFAEHLTVVQGFPRVDWEAVDAWARSLGTPALHEAAWDEAEQAWLLHLRDALGDNYRLVRAGRAALLSSLKPGVADATLDYMGRTLNRVVKVLDGIAQAPSAGADIQIVFETEEQYYQYVSYYYPDDGEFAFSSGTYLSAGCPHFVTVLADLHSVEPVIAHEMTHACLAHLPLPLWLDEGLAVNTEQRVAQARPSMFTPHELHAMHQDFWGPAEIQEFWSGESFERADDGNMLSYDLARILVEQFSFEWEPFSAFVRAAHHADGGAAAAQAHLGLHLGACVAAILKKPDATAYEPAVDAIPPGDAQLAVPER